MALLLVSFRPGDEAQARGLVQALGLPVTLVVAHDGPIEGVGATRTVRLGEGAADALAPAIRDLASGHSHIAAVSSMAAKDVLPRVAGLLDAPMVSEAIAISGPDTFERPTYAGALVETVRVSGSPILLTFWPSGFPGGGDHPNADEEAVALATSRAEVVSRNKRDSARPDLGAAKRVISGGKPLKDAETFERVVGGFADAMGGAVGATRAAVDSGIAPNELQVGQTGKIVAPDLYIAAGISGSTQHMAGIKDSKLIVAINRDADAPIFKVADLGIVGDLFEILPQLQAKIEARNNG